MRELTPDRDRFTIPPLLSLSSDICFDGDSTVSFKLVLPSLKKVELALCIPDNYPKEEFNLLGNLSSSGDIKTYPASNLQGVLAKIVDGNPHFISLCRCESLIIDFFS